MNANDIHWLLYIILLLIAIVIVLIAGVAEESPPFAQQSSQQFIIEDTAVKEYCAEYIRDDQKIEYCATCGNGACERYERCIASNIQCEEIEVTVGLEKQSRVVCTESDDCGPLYCTQDCLDI